MTTWALTDSHAGEAAHKADISELLGAKSSLHLELALFKSDICKTIEVEIYKVTATLRGEIATLRAENQLSQR